MANILKTILLILFILILLTGIVGIGVFLKKQYDKMFSSANPPATEPTNNNNNNPTPTDNAKKPTSIWDMLKTIAIIVLIIAVIFLLLKFKSNGDIDFEKAAEDTMFYLIKMGYPFKYVDRENRLSVYDYNEVKKQKEFGALNYVLPGSQVYYLGEDIQFGRCLFRFSFTPKIFGKVFNPNWDVSSNEMVCVSVNPNKKNILSRVTFLNPMDVKDCNEYIHKQVYGFEVSPEPAKKPSLIDSRAEESLKKQTMDLQKQAIAEGAVQ